MAVHGFESMVDVMAILLATATALYGNAAGAAKTPMHTARAETGGTIYEQACASCHGARGEGAADWEARDANGELPAPPHDASGHTWKHSDAMLYRLVQQGWRNPFNKTPRFF